MNHSGRKVYFSPQEEENNGHWRKNHRKNSTRKSVQLYSQQAHFWAIRGKKEDPAELQREQRHRDPDIGLNTTVPRVTAHSSTRSRMELTKTAVIWFSTFRLSP